MEHGLWRILYVCVSTHTHTRTELWQPEENKHTHTERGGMEINNTTGYIDLYTQLEKTVVCVCMCARERDARFNSPAICFLCHRLKKVIIIWNKKGGAGRKSIEENSCCIDLCASRSLVYGVCTRLICSGLFSRSGSLIDNTAPCRAIRPFYYLLRLNWESSNDDGHKSHSASQKYKYKKSNLYCSSYLKKKKKRWSRPENIMNIIRWGGNEEGERP